MTLDPGMTLLDHSSIDALLVGLQEHRGVFRFLYEAGGTTEPWRLAKGHLFKLSPASLQADAVRLRVDFLRRRDGYRLWLDSDGWLVKVQRPIVPGSPVCQCTDPGCPHCAGAEWRKMTGLSKMRAMRQARATAADDTLRRADRRRDRGLADIFGIA